MKKAAVIILKMTAIITCLGCLVSWIYLDSKYAEHSPRNPVPETGNIYKTWVHHGAVVYLTKEEYTWQEQTLMYIFLAGFLAGLIALIIEKGHKAFSRDININSNQE